MASAPRDARCLAGFLLGLPLAGCMSVQALEPVEAPPLAFRGNATVDVEFVAPPMIGARCAQRGARFLGLPAFNAGACADETLVTLPNPCLTFTGGDYASSLCTLLSAANKDGRSSTVSIAFTDLDHGSEGIAAAPNPCTREGWYARLACHELGHVNGWAGAEPTPGPASESPLALAWRETPQGP